MRLVFDEFHGARTAKYSLRDWPNAAFDIWGLSGWCPAYGLEVELPWFHYDSSYQACRFVAECQEGIQKHLALLNHGDRVGEVSHLLIAWKGVSDGYLMGAMWATDGAWDYQGTGVPYWMTSEEPFVPVPVKTLWDRLGEDEIG